MRTVRRLLYRDIAGAVLFVAAAFLSLFYFIDFVDEMGDVGKGGYTLGDAALSGLMELPGHFYELFPIAVLIGTIYSLSRMAQSSEFTILRTGGLGPGRALVLLATLGVGFAIVTFVTGDYVAPAAERAAVAMKVRFAGGRQLGKTGAWLRDSREDGAEGHRSVTVNVQRIASDGRLEDIRLFEFDADGKLLTRVAAARGALDGQRGWQFDDASVTRWPGDDGRLSEQRFERLAWPSNLSPSVVAAAVLPLGTMTTLELWRYSTHLASREQAAQRYAIQFWKKALYPFACLVMVALALPFAYLSARAGGISLKVFGGILLGISFVLLNNVASHLGVLRDWTPWVAAAAPSVLYLLLSLAAFFWLVRYR